MQIPLTPIPLTPIPAYADPAYEPWLRSPAGGVDADRADAAAVESRQMLLRERLQVKKLQRQAKRARVSVLERKGRAVHSKTESGASAWIWMPLLWSTIESVIGCMLFLFVHSYPNEWYSRVSPSISGMPLSCTPRRHRIPRSTVGQGRAARRAALTCTARPRADGVVLQPAPIPLPWTGKPGRHHWAACESQADVGRKVARPTMEAAEYGIYQVYRALH